MLTATSEGMVNHTRKVRVKENKVYLDKIILQLLSEL